MASKRRMSGKNHYGIEFDGFTEMIAQFDRMDGDLKKIISECLHVVPEVINPKLEAAMKPHRQTGKTEEAIVRNQRARWDGNIGRIAVGFDIKHGGFPSIFLLYGSARHAPRNQYGDAKRDDAKDVPERKRDKKLYNALFGKAVKREIAEKQQILFTNALKELMAKRG